MKFMRLVCLMILTSYVWMHRKVKGMEKVLRDRLLKEVLHA